MVFYFLSHLSQHTAFYIFLSSITSHSSFALSFNYNLILDCICDMSSTMIIIICVGNPSLKLNKKNTVFV